MITIGVDAHKRVHVALALDEAGREIGHWQGENSRAGWNDVQPWALSFGAARQWGIENAWAYGRGLAQHLVAADEAVYDVNPRWTALRRRSARRPEKTDRLDARAVALFVRQESSGLPQVQADDETAVLDLLTIERNSALAEATRLRNQIHALLVQLDPQYQDRLPTLKSRAGLAALETYASPDNRSLSLARAAAVRRLAQRLRLALGQAEELASQIKDAASRFSSLTELCGINLLTAGAIAGILGPGRRFETDAQLAYYAGAAPLEASSAGIVRHRLNRGGNRRLNAILYRIALTQAHHSEEAQTYLHRRTTQGKTKREAIRALKRYIARAIWRLWQECCAVGFTPQEALVA
jgi:transposase